MVTTKKINNKPNGKEKGVRSIYLFYLHNLAGLRHTTEELLGSFSCFGGVGFGHRLGHGVAAGREGVSLIEIIYIYIFLVIGGENGRRETYATIGPAAAVDA